MNLGQLEMRLERLQGFERPTARLEQYQTPAPVAARLLHHAAMQGAIGGATGLRPRVRDRILACGAALLDASNVTGVDIDPAAIEIARQNAEMLGSPWISSSPTSGARMLTGRGSCATPS